MAIYKCITCGKTFETMRLAKYCPYGCREKNRKEKIRRKTLSPNGHYKRIAKNGNMKRIAEMDAKAKALGMSYGQYDAMLRMKEGTLYGKS